MTKVSDFIIERLSHWGIKRIYGYPGDGISGMLGALDRAKKNIRFIQVRHEEMAALMACAHAKFTGEVGVCLATSGPGAIHLLNGLYDAKMDHQPVVALVGQPARSAMGGHYQQEVDLISLFKDVAHEFVHTATDSSQVRHLIDRAIRIAKTERTVTCVVLPNDVQNLEAVKEPQHKHYSLHTGIGHTSSILVPRQEELKKAADILNKGKRVAILAGAGALHAGEEVHQIAEALGAGVAKALLGKAVLPDTLSYVTGSIGFFGTTATEKMMEECDTLLMIGTSFPYSEFLPKEGQAKAVQIDIDGRMLSLRYPVHVNLLGDSKETLLQLIPLLKRKEDQSWRKEIEEKILKWEEEQESEANIKNGPLKPQLVFKELSHILPDRSILTADSGSVASWYARELKIRTGMMGSLSGSLATMGCAIPYAIAAKFAYPDRPVFAFAGDGSMQMNGNLELITIAKYWKEWSNSQLIICVLNNQDLNMVTWEQRLMQGEPKFKASQQLPDFHYADYAESIGLAGLRINSLSDVGEAWKAALGANKPFLLEAVTDPDVSPFPNHILMKNYGNLASSVMKGDRAAMKTAGQKIKQKIKDILKDS